MKTPFDYGKRKKLVQRTFGVLPYFWAYFSWQRMEAFIQEAAEALNWRDK